jgi:hypothetical protein
LAKKCWDLFIILLAIYNCLSIPIVVAFNPDYAKSSSMEVNDNMIDILFLCDIVVTFRTTYLTAVTGEEQFS